MQGDGINAIFTKLRRSAVASTTCQLLIPPHLFKWSYKLSKLLALREVYALGGSDITSSWSLVMAVFAVLLAKIKFCLANYFLPLPYIPLYT